MRNFTNRTYHKYPGASQKGSSSRFVTMLMIWSADFVVVVIIILYISFSFCFRLQQMILFSGKISAWFTKWGTITLSKSVVCLCEICALCKVALEGLSRVKLYRGTKSMHQIPRFPPFDPNFHLVRTMNKSSDIVPSNFSNTKCYRSRIAFLSESNATSRMLSPLFVGISMISQNFYFTIFFKNKKNVIWIQQENVLIRIVVAL